MHKKYEYQTIRRRLASQIGSSKQNNPVYCAKEHSTSSEILTTLPYPRLSLCLRGIAQYQVIEDQKITVVSIKPGQVIYVEPDAAMEPVRESHYEAMGFLYHPTFLRLLMAVNQPRSRCHKKLRYTHVLHLQTEPDPVLELIHNAIILTSNQSTLWHLIQTLFVITKSMLEQNMPHETLNLNGKSQVSYLAACQFLQEHFSEKITRTEVGTFLKLHPNHISRLFQKHSNQSFVEYLTQLRLDKSRMMLRQTDLNIAEIAELCGFANSNYFIRCYKNKFGYSPSQQPDRGVE